MKVERDPPLRPLRSQPAWVRLFIVIVASGLVAFYLPVLAVVLTGQWKNNLTNGSFIALSLVIFAVQNLIGMAVRRPILSGYGFGAAWLVVSVLSVVTSKRLEDWAYWWPVLFAQEAGSVINGYCLNYLALRLTPDLIKPASDRGSAIITKGD